MELKKLKMEERKLLQSGDEMENDFAIWSQFWGSKILIGGFDFEMGIYIEIGNGGKKVVVVGI